MLGRGSYLVLLPAVAEARLAEVIHDRFAAHAIIIEICDVVIFTLERLTGGIFAFASDLADALRGIENSTNVFPGRAGSRVASTPDGWGKVMEDC